MAIEPTDRKPSPWSEEIRQRQKPPIEKKPSRAWRGLLIITIIALVAAAVWVIYFRKPAGPSVGLQFAQPDKQILVGDPFTLNVSFSNYSDTVLKNVKVSLFLPDEGVALEGQSAGQRVVEIELGDVGPGSITPESFNLIATGVGNMNTTAEGGSRRITAKASYETPQNATVFETQAQTDLVVGQPAVALNLTIPQNVLNGSDFEIKANYVNNTGHEFKNLRLKIDYPPAFQFKRSTMQTEDAGNSSWFLGDLPAGANGIISITGSIIGPEKSFFGFNGTLASTFLGETYVVNSQAASLAILAAPLSVAVNLNNSQDYIAHLGDTLTYTITYANNSGVVMQNINLSAKLTSAIYDFKSLSPDIPFNSLTNTITWFAGNTPQFMNLAPGQSGSIEFSIKLKNAFPIRLLSDKNYTLNVDAKIESPTVPPNTMAEKTVSLANISNKVAGKVDIIPLAYWRDAKSGILNNGPYPPKVNTPTQYTIHWRIINYATDMGAVTVSAYLQSGVRFTGVVKSGISSSSPVYSPNSGMVSWQIPFIAATKGITSSPVEAIFQVEATPAVNQLGQNMPLMSETHLQATDSFIGMPFEATTLALDTGIPNDTTITTPNRLVRQ